MTDQQQPLTELIYQLLDDMKAIDIKVLDARNLTSITDNMIICCGTSGRHTKAIANNALTELKQAGHSVNIEGEQDGDWILLDAGDAIIHVMLPKARAFYNLEGLWDIDHQTATSIANEA